MMQKIAVALIFASAVGWLLVVPWWVLILRQVRLEEAHLHKLFGREYEAYARQTARVVPGIY
jgi:protein-S-isoprenylcysteine O-methyltransferase Ste14